MAEEFIEEIAPGRRPYARIIFVLQAALVASVVGWVLDLQRSVLGLAVFNEKLVVTVLGLAIAICFLTAPASPRFRGRVPWWDAAAGFLGLALCLYIARRYPALSDELTARPLDGVLISGALAVLVLEGTRRMTGFSLVGFTLAGVVYAMLGHHLPGVFQSRPVDFTRLLVYLGLDTNALLGTSLDIAITVVVPFILLGQLLGRCGGSEFFTDLARAWMGRYRGGSAKVAVVGSAFFGMISGSAVANVSAVGVVTIPLMKRSGYPAQIAAAIEAVGSTGGQLMPPVMGAAAFLMAEVLQVPYPPGMVAPNIPGLPFGLTLQLLAITGESLPVLLLLTAVMAILLGLGLPTVGVYIIMATLIAPALEKVGVPAMAAHMFLLYFGIMSMVTPPVALSAFAAANIAGADVDKTGWTATRIGWAAYIVPFLFVLSPSLLMEGNPLAIAWAVATAALGIWLGTIGVVGFFYRPIAAPAAKARSFPCAALRLRGTRPQSVQGNSRSGET